MRFVIHFLLFLLAALAVLQCSLWIREVRAQEYPVIRQDKTEYDTVHQNLNYFWDERTGLCFASATFITAYGSRVTVFTNVPCTEKVWVLIRGGK